MKKNRRNATTYDDKSDGDDIISIFSLVRQCFGNTAGFLTGLLFLLLIKATLIAQLSKVGVLLEEIDILNLGLNRGLCTILFSFIVATTCLVGKQRSIERINDVLTSTMLLSFASVVALASRSGWSLDGLNHINYKSLFPSVGGGESPWVVPIFIQLLLYNEVVPLISDRLGDEKKVRRAILFGSSVPLLMCLIWTCIALGIVPYDQSLFDCRSSNAIYDPLSRLGERVLTKGGFIGNLFLVSVNIMAGSAICTTVFGSILATIQYLDDVIANSFGERRGRNNRISKIAKHAFAIIPSVCIAVLGSKELYYHATAFAGEFPCCSLFGLLPPLCNLRLRWAQKEQGETIQLKHVTSQVLLATVSAAILAVCRLSKCK
jgi:tyrosine-specific transport protein